MSNPISPEKCESLRSIKREHKRKERKMWKKPIKISKFSSSDQIPIIFSGYTPETEDSSSSDISDDDDDSRTHSNSSDQSQELDQERSRSVRRKILKRQSTRKVSVLTKMRSMKKPHYLRPTSSSASKNVEKIQKVARLKRISSLRYNGLLKATCSSAMKGLKSSSNDVCNYQYCSLHGRRHSHGVADGGSGPSLKRFISMRRRQKSVNRRLVLLKRSLSRKSGVLGGGNVTDQEPKHEDDEDVDEEELSGSENEAKPVIMDGSDGESNQEVYKEDISSSVMVDVALENEEVCRNNEDVWNDTVALVRQAFDEVLGEITDDEDKSEDDMSDSSSSRDKHLTVIMSSSCKGEETRGAKKWSYVKRVILLKRFLKALDRRERRELSDGEESEAMRLRRKLVGERKNAEEWMLDHALRQVISTLDSSQKRKVKHLVKAFESLIPMDRGHDDLGCPEREENDIVNSQNISRDIEDIQEQDLEVCMMSIGMKSGEAFGSKEDASSSHDIGSPEREENETMNSQTILRDDKDTNVLLDTKVSSEASSSMSIGTQSDEAFESKEDGGSSHDIGSPEREENETVNLQTILRDINDTTDVVQEKDLEETKLTSEVSSSLSIGMESEDSSSSQEVDRLALEKEEKRGDSEQQNLSTWRNLIHKHMDTSDNSERKRDETEQEHKSSYGNDQMIEEDGDAATVKSIQEAFEKILAEIPGDTDTVSESSNSPKVEKEEQGETKKSWNRVRKVVLLKRFVKSLDSVRVINPRKVRNLPVESTLEAENVLLRHRAMMERSRTAKEELMLDYAMRQAISRLAPVQRKKVELLVQAFDTVLDGHETSDTPRKPRVEENCEVKKYEEKIKNVFSRLHQRDLKGEEEVVSTPRNLLPPIKNVKQRIVVEKEKDSKLWKLLYKHMVTEKEGGTDSVESECDDEANDARRSGTVTYVREALEKILSEIPDNSSDDQSIDSDITTEQELFEEVNTFKPKRVKGWNNVKKVILLKRFVSDLGSLSRLSPKTPRVLPWEPDPETEKIRLRHQEMGGKRNTEEWMLDYALRQAISTLAPSQKRKVTLLAQAFDTISLQDLGSGSTPGSATTSRNISRQSSVSSMTVHSENEGSNAEILRGRLRNLQESTKLDVQGNDIDEKQQCSGLWRLLCKQMEDNERNQTLPEETSKDEQEEEVTTNVDSEKMEVYHTEAVELLGEVIDGISLEENQDQKPLLKVRSNRWSNLKKVILLRRFVKALDNVRKFNPKEPKFLPLNPDVEAEKVNLRHQETQNKRNDGDWMVDNALQGVVSQLTPARKLKVQLLVQAFESLSASGN